MPRNKISIRRSWDSASTRYIAGNKPIKRGGTPALEWMTAGTLVDGEIITIKSNLDGALGTPDPRAQSLSMVGNQTLVNGINNPWLENYSVNQLLAGFKDAGEIGRAHV